MATKYIECTGSPKSAGFSTKEIFLSALAPYGFEHGKMTKKNNVVTILVTNDKDSTTTKMSLAEELGVEIMTYEELKDAYGIDGDIE